ncbi:hypothetical protein, variant [Saprolegnia diclina VS20]|uniref:Uncharacterized protein n=1 Tax=Saprolegnia diclina (strain VS20) TaxID=1156394 RepID=T0RC35_SAPDV|nr:hypothetical protein, variant [Saprolegnia diclina VS20]EQC27152.1 hypothetical protein, variant [Saprolegnia diclina VS20]|eukprot:XP_008619437.1 hypothetical protein, variant [Saprolegnia diclina VS20]
MSEPWTPTFGLKRAGVSAHKRQSTELHTLRMRSHDMSFDVDAKSASPGRRYLQQQAPKRSPKRSHQSLPGSILVPSDSLHPSQSEPLHLAYSASIVLGPTTLRPSSSAALMTPSIASSSATLQLGRPKPQRVLSRKTLEPPELHTPPSTVAIETKRHLAFGGGFLVDNQVAPSTSPTKQRPQSTVRMYFISPPQDDL